MRCDAFAMSGGKRKFPRFFGDEEWKFIVVLRKHEYYLNKKNKSFLLIFYKYLHHKKGLKLGFTIPCNVFGPGLRINHHGLIVVNPKAQIGSWCDIHQGVNIGESIDSEAPKIGDNVFIGPGVKIFGSITIGNNIMIGANAVVNKSFEIDGVNIAGIPAKIINSKGNFYAKHFE